MTEVSQRWSEMMWVLEKWQSVPLQTAKGAWESIQMEWGQSTDNDPMPRKYSIEPSMLKGLISRTMLHYYKHGGQPSIT